MSKMNLHILNVQKKLEAHCQWMSNCLNDTYERAQKVMSVPSLDVVVKAGTFVIPEKGHLGYCPEAGIIYLTVDPENPEFCKNDAHSLERMFAHELHHATRWVAPGYGCTLGEVIVSEGLAGHFSLELFGGESEPWERLSPDIIHPYIQQLSENWNKTNYDHNTWFYGTSDLPKWLGYTSGFNIVSRYLATCPHLKASMLVDINADELRSFI